MNQVVIGMSGHIDHGKTSIIKALTGTNTERHNEEIRRGMTIDIGFAFLSKSITLIDVPGHEKFVKNMMAGASGIDIALLVIAADDGVMPQTCEHFEILKLLKIKIGIIVINKIDLVEDDWLELVVSDVKELVKNSFFDVFDVIKVSASTKKGINRLSQKIVEVSNLVKRQNSDGLFRMPIDRSFSMKGFGTVVTGTVAAGQVNVSQNIEILPGNKIAKVRGMQTHLNSVDVVRVGDRAALNLQNVDLEEVTRGSHIVESNYFNLVKQVGAVVEVLSSSQFEIHQNQRVRIHIGTSEVMARIALTNKKSIKPGQCAPALLKLEEQIVAAYKDRFIIRLFSPVITIGGGELVDVDISGKWSEIKKQINNIFSSKKENRILLLISKYGMYPLKKNSISKLLNLSSIQIENLLDTSTEIVSINYKNYEWILTKSQLKENKEKVLVAIDNFHNKNRFRSGTSKEELLQILKIDTIFVDFIIDELNQKNKINNNNNVISIPGFKIQLSEEEREIKGKLLNILSNERFTSSDLNLLSEKLNQDSSKIKLLLSMLEDEKQIIRLDGNLMFTEENFLLLKKNVINFFNNSSTLSVAQFKDIADTSRKYAIPLLEYFDKLKITYRDKDSRKLNEK